MPNRELGDDEDRNTDRLLGEIVAELRGVKHAQANVATEVKAVGVQVAPIPALIDQVKIIRQEQERHNERIRILEKDKDKRDGAVSIITWLSRNWPVAAFMTLLAAVIAWANGKFAA